MPSLSQLLTSHGSLLVLDSAATSIQVGLLRPDMPALWRNSPGEAGAGIFAGTESVLAEARMKIAAVDAFVFCEGPGSMLGIRTVAMALRTWQVLRPRPAYAYQSLAIAAHFEWTRGKPRNFSVIADARRDAWHCQQIDAARRLTPLQRLPATGLPHGELLTPENFRAWVPPPRPTSVCGYDLAKIFPAIAQNDCFRPVETPDAFQHQAPDYKKWSAQIHRATVAPLR